MSRPGPLSTRAIARHRLAAPLGWAAALVAMAAGGGCVGATTGPVAGGPPSGADRGVADPQPTDHAATDARSAPSSCARATARTLPSALRHASRGGGSVALARAPSEPLLAYVAREDDDAIGVIDVAARREIAAFAVAGGPTQLVVLPDGRVAVSLRRSNEVAILEPDPAPATPWTERCRAPVGHAEPIGLATSPDGASLHVASGWGAAISTFDTRDLALRGSVAVPREPRAIAQPRPGGPIFASHAVGSVASRIAVEPDGSPGVVTTIGLGATSTNRRTRMRSRFEVNQGFALVSDATRVFVPGAAVLPRSAELTSSSSGAFADGYGGGDEPPVRPTVRVLDAASGAPVALGTGRPTRIEPCVLPRAADLGAPGKLYVACTNLDAVVELDARAPEPADYELRRFLVPTGPTGLAVDASSGVAVTWSPSRAEVGVVDLEIGAAVAVPVSTRGAPILTARESRGRDLFRDGTEPRIGFDGRACESCHPDGRDDGLTWSTPDGPRQTISLAGRGDATGDRFGWFGEHRSLEEHMRHTMRRLGGVGFSRPVDRRDLDALMAWVRALPAPVLPAGSGGDDATITRGRSAFTRAGCAACHVDGGTDGRAHDVATGDAKERRLAFDTPSLRGVGASAPYMHDGSFDTLESMLAEASGPMGAAKSMDDGDRAAIADYMRSLMPQGERRAPGGPLTPPPSPDAVPVARAAATGPFQRMMRGLPRDEARTDRLARIDLDALAIHDVETLPQPVWVRYPIAPATVALQTSELADATRDGVRYAKGALRFDRAEWGTVHEGQWAYDQRAMDAVVDLPRRDRFVDVSWARFDEVAGDRDARRFRAAEGYADHQRGEIALRRRVDVLARPVAGTSVYAYIQRCRRCVAEERTKLVLVGRSAGPEDVRVEAVPIRRGGSGSGSIAATSLDGAPSWKEGAGPRVIQRVAVEISWAETEDEPSAYAAVSR